MIETHLLSALKDNYIAIVREPSSGLVAIVDPSEPGTSERFLDSRGWRPKMILNTHHHYDHVGGNLALRERYRDVPVVTSALDSKRIPGASLALNDGETIAFGSETIRAIHVPGHTLGHTAYLFERSLVLFAGDTLFSLGCGRLFEGSAAQMWASLLKLRELPANTRVYCGHEYTLANSRFALELEPSNLALKRRSQEAAQAAAEGRPTLPSTIEMECLTNPFLRADHPELRSALRLPESTTAEEVFAELRKLKDAF